MSQERDDDDNGVVPADGSDSVDLAKAGSSAVAGEPVAAESAEAEPVAAAAAGGTATATRRRRGSAEAPVVPTGKAGRGGEVVAGTRRDADEPEDTRTPRANPITYLKQVVEELRKVIWPTRSQMVTYTIVVFLFLIFMSALVAGVDYGAGKLVELVFKK